MPLQAGSRLGPYEVITLIGTGGMGEVWLATELRLGRKVALKLLPGDLTRDPVRIQRFEQEARAASALNHPNVCTIHALGETEGQHYIAMEYVEGETLRRRLPSSALSLREALDIAIQVAAALCVAHAAGIVHRDIKPENVMLRPDGVVKVLDFGLAKLTTVGPGADTTRLGVNTGAGAVVGTAAYMSPEQARGQQVDARTDIWSLGVMLYEMIAGRSPFVAPSGSDVLAAILQNEPVPLARFDPDAPPEVQRILTKTLRKDRSQRYQTVQDLLLDLQALREDLASRARAGSGPVSPTTATPTASDSAQAVRPDPPRRRGVLLAMVAALLVLAMAVGTWTWRRARLAPTAAPTVAGVHRNLTRLTFGPGLQTDVTWSPDGTRIAYTSDRSGNYDIWSQPIAGGDAVQVTKSPASDTQPAWSPDGRSIVFRSEREGGGLFLVPAFGGPERQLTSFGVHPRWSAAGTEITFHAGSAGTPGKLYRISPQGGEPPHEILDDFLRGGGWYWIGFHPDGRLSAIGLTRKGEYGFYTVSRPTGSVTTSSIPATIPLAARDQGSRVVQFQWNADGTALYVVAVVNEVRNLWKVRVEPRTLAWLSAERLTTGMGADVSAALSPDGTRIVFTMQRASVRLWVYPFDAVAGRVTGEGRPVTPEEGEVTSWDLSPDGRRIAYGLNRPGSNRADLWLTEIDSGRRELLAENGFGPVWSPDGTMIAYNLFRPDRPPPGEWALATRELAGTERVLGSWSTKGVLLVTDWTRDGSAILGSYLSPPYIGRARLALWPRSNAAGTTPERVLLDDVGANIWQGRYSPDGRWLSFVAQPLEETGVLRLVVVPASGAVREQWTAVAPEHRWADKPRWAPDGRTIYFLSGQDSSFFNLWGSRFDSARGKPVGKPFKITHFDAPGLMMSPDIVQTQLGIAASRAVLTMANVTGNIWMLDNVDK